MNRTYYNEWDAPTAAFVRSFVEAVTDAAR